MDTTTAEPTLAQRITLDNYIAARRELEGLKDDIDYGSEWEASRARRKLGYARTTLLAAAEDARRHGVLADARHRFR